MATPGDMSEKSNAPPERTERIVDLVFAGELGGRTRRLAAGGAAVIALYALAILLVGRFGRFGRSGASVCAEMAARVHDAIAADRAVDVTPPPPPPPPAAAPPTPHVAESAIREHTHVAPLPHTAPAPAQAGRLAAASESPVDFTGSAFVVGSGPSYAGGTTTRSGTSPGPVTGPAASNGSGNLARSRARPVTLDAENWNCSWPAEADARQVDQETVVIRVQVGADGRSDRVDVVEDPGFGFGAAARQCALVTRFGAARNAAGDPIAALSPAIRVHFHR
jgi:periplasmic protein TonB